MGQLSVIWVGDRDRQEFSVIAAAVASCTEVRFVRTASKIVPATAVDLVLLAESRPGELPESELAEARKRCPQSRLCRLLGSWCEGTLLSPSQDGVAVYYTHEWQGRVNLALLKEAGSQQPADQLPPPHQPNKRRSVAIYARTAGDRQAIADACENWGTDTIQLGWASPTVVSRVDLVLWEADVSTIRRQDELAQLRTRHGDARIVALMTFPRAAEIQRLAAAGVRVVSRPFKLDVLGELVESQATASDLTDPFSSAA